MKSTRINHARYILYSGKLSREKIFANWWKYNFRWENFRGLLAFAAPKDATPQISRGKLSRIATKPRNSRKFSPSKVFRYTVTAENPQLITAYECDFQYIAKEEKICHPICVWYWNQSPLGLGGSGLRGYTFGWYTFTCSFPLSEDSSNESQPATESTIATCSIISELLPENQGLHIWCH